MTIEKRDTEAEVECAQGRPTWGSFRCRLPRGETSRGLLCFRTVG